MMMSLEQESLGSGKILTDDRDLMIRPADSLEKDLVSILVPCYNVTRYLGRFLDCLTAQTYKKLEIVFADDGSTDETLQMIYSRVPELTAQGYRVKLLSHTNQGVSPTLNRALKYFTGEFLCWADPDDTYDSVAIEKRVVWLKANPNAGGVMSQCRLFRQHAGKVTELIFNEKKINSYEGHMAWPLVRREISPFPIVYMIRSAAFLEKVPDREIYHDAVGGQNFQVIMPVFLSCRIGFLKEANCTYYRYDDSHSRRNHSFEGYHSLAQAAYRAVMATLQRFPDTEVFQEYVRRQVPDSTFRDAFRYWHLREALKAAREMHRYKDLKVKHFFKIFLLLFLSPFRGLREKQR